MKDFGTETRRGSVIAFTELRLHLHIQWFTDQCTPAQTTQRQRHAVRGNQK
jgi:hypothetical protein